jgi:hypothetical protein
MAITKVSRRTRQHPSFMRSVKKIIIKGVRLACLWNQSQSREQLHRSGTIAGDPIKSGNGSRGPPQKTAPVIFMPCILIIKTLLNQLNSVSWQSMAGNNRVGSQKLILGFVEEPEGMNRRYS